MHRQYDNKRFNATNSSPFSQNSATKNPCANRVSGPFPGRLRKAKMSSCCPREHRRGGVEEKKMKTTRKKRPTTEPGRRTSKRREPVRRTDTLLLWRLPVLCYRPVNRVNECIAHSLPRLAKTILTCARLPARAICSE